MRPAGPKLRAEVGRGPRLIVPLLEGLTKVAIDQDAVSVSDVRSSCARIPMPAPLSEGSGRGPAMEEAPNGTVPPSGALAPPTGGSVLAVRADQLANAAPPSGALALPTSGSMPAAEAGQPTSDRVAARGQVKLPRGTLPPGKRDGLGTEASSTRVGDTVSRGVRGWGGGQVESPSAARTIGHAVADSAPTPNLVAGPAPSVAAPPWAESARPNATPWGCCATELPVP